MTRGELRWSFQCGCGKHSIVLPRRIREETFSGPRDRPTGGWTLVVQCPQDGRLFSPTPATLRFGPAAMEESGQEMSLWMVEFACAHESCGARYEVFPWWPAAASDDEVIGRVQRELGELSCREGHALAVDWMAASALPLEGQK